MFPYPTFCRLGVITGVLGVKRAISGVRLKNDCTLVPYGRYSLGSGAVADSACTMMPVTRQPPASLIA